MKRMKRLTAVLTAAAMLVMNGTAMPFSGVTASAAGDTQDDWLHVENGKVVDMNGKEVWMTGVNWFGYNCGRQVFDGVWSKNMHSMLNQIADHGFNLLRVPMSTQIILQWKNKGSDKGSGVGEVNMMVNPYENPELTEEGGVGGEGNYTLKYSFDIWNMAVDWCRENGMKIMIDIHSATSASSGHQLPLWYDSNFSTDDWLEALSWFCDYYKDNDTIIAIDLKNEPHGKPEEGKFAKWDDSKDDNNWKYAAERGAMACLKSNPNLLIMIEGIECYPDFANGADWTTPAVDYAHYDEPSKVFGAWWGGNLRGVKDHPVDIGEYKKQIVYSPHDYGPLVWSQKWFYMDDDSKTFSRETLLDDYWRDTWAYLVEDNMYPLLMGEWGGFIDKEHDPTGENKHWMQELRDYMIDKHIHHTFWCFNENSGDTGGLVYDDFGKWDEEKYKFVEKALWQDENGVFIGLDHKIPIGKNGQSLSDYYGGGVNGTTPTVKSETTTTASSEKTTETTTVTTVSSVSSSETTSSSVTTSSSSSSASSETSGSSPQKVKWGDTNCDQQIDVSDAVLLSRFVAEDATANLTAEGKANAEVTGDGVLTGDDTVKILKYIAKLITDEEFAPAK